LCRAGSNGRPFNDANGADAYHFPIFSAPLPEDISAASQEKACFKTAFEEQSSVPGFSPLFGREEEEEDLSVTEDVDDGAEERAARMREEAYEEGFVAGLKAGEKAQKEMLEGAVEALSSAVLKLDAVESEYYRDAERHAVEIGLMIARKLVLREISIDETAIFRVLKEALGRVRDQKEIHVKLHPADLEAVTREGVDLPTEAKGKRNVHFEPGEDLRRGECVVETDFGDIDARIDNQLETIEESLREALQEGALYG
jgi:flagellar assembly protein FliH